MAGYALASAKKGRTKISKIGYFLMKNEWQEGLLIQYGMARFMILLHLLLHYDEDEGAR
jgi:hypothetical protein